MKLKALTITLLYLLFCSCEKEETPTTPEVSKGTLSIQEINLTASNGDTFVIPFNEIDSKIYLLNQDKVLTEKLDLSNHELGQGKYRLVLTRKNLGKPHGSIPSFTIEEEFSITEGKTTSLSIEKEIEITDKLINLTVSDNLFNRFNELNISFQFDQGVYTITSENNAVNNTIYVANEYPGKIEIHANINGNNKYKTLVIMNNNTSEDYNLNEILANDNPFSEAHTTGDLLTYFRILGNYDPNAHYNSNVQFFLYDNPETLKGSHFYLERLRMDNIQENSIMKDLPKDILNYEELDSLSITYSDIISLPQGLSTLKYLELGSLQINEIPENLPNLEHLSLDVNEFFTDALKLENTINTYTELKTFDLKNRSLSVLPNISKGCTKIENLKIEQVHRDVYNTTPEWISTFKNLKSFELIRGQEQSVPSFFKEMKTLERITFYGCEIAEIPNWLVELPNLTSISFEKNKINGAIPDFLYDLEKLKYINLRLNELTGSISMGFTKLKQIEYVNLNENYLDTNPPQEVIDHIPLFHFILQNTPE
ncbi:leucine-rich repeat domain-containing protein [Flammeovirga aprica]|uniref:Uncharacterized protein n=1 Tax=Flammeovirga aprica JL-4 TaxID=694437 RepID=A0A7X9S1X9_9BACT|nr:hypothetical protein [Flammeovirga aprica]NME72789.1 hypothetical protein [Flammeovirga aprica JL-4]